MTPKEVTTSYGVLWTAAAGLPVLSHGASLFINVEPGAWLAMPTALRWSLAADAVLYTVGCAIVTAPLSGVAVAAGRRAAPVMAAAWRTVWPLVVAVLLFAAMSSLLTLAWSVGREDAAMFVARSHVTLLAVALALTAWGAACGASFRDPLDAAAVSLVVTLIAAGGLLVAGAPVADVPQPFIALGLVASPLVVVASAAHIDIVRMDLLYQISPLAHMQMDYPSWYSASAGYLALAFTCFARLRTRSGS